jgi:hypothetical protein
MGDKAQLSATSRCWLTSHLIVGRRQVNIVAAEVSSSANSSSQLVSKVKADLASRLVSN